MLHRRAIARVRSTYPGSSNRKGASLSADVQRVLDDLSSRSSMATYVSLFTNRFKTDE